MQVADEARAVAADGEQPPEVEGEDSSSMIPTQNGGKPRPTSGTARTAWSARRSRCVGRQDRQRHGDQHREQAPKPISHSVTRQAVEHERPRRRRRTSDVPRSPCSSRAMNFSYWPGSGRSRPHSWWSSATRCGVALFPRIVRAGSPGTRWIRKKTRIVTPSAIGTSCSSRRDDVRRRGSCRRSPCASQPTSRARRPPGGSCRAARPRSRAPCSSTHSGTASSRGSPGTRLGGDASGSSSTAARASPGSSRAAPGATSLITVGLL